MEPLASQTAGALLAGLAVLYPTDTIWGIGCDARNAAAVARLYKIKERDPQKSMLILCTEDIVDLDACPQLATDAGRPTTYILPPALWQRVLKTPVAANLAAADGSLGIRLPRHTFCREVISRLGAPLVSTSANLSGRLSPQRYEDIDKELLRRVDFCVPPLAALESHETHGSRIVKLLADGTQTVIRP